MTLIWKSLLSQTRNICTDLVSDYSNADIHPALCKSEFPLGEKEKFHWWEVPWVSCPVWRVVAIEWSTLPTVVLKHLWKDEYLLTSIAYILGRLKWGPGWHGWVEGDRNSHSHYCLQEPDRVPPPLSLALFKEESKSAIFTRLTIWKTNSKREFQRLSSCLAQLSS